MANKLSFDHSDRTNPYRVDGQPVTMEQYMAAPIYSGIKADKLKQAYDAWYTVEDECGSKSIASSVVERNYGKEYAMEIGRNT